MNSNIILSIKLLRDSFSVRGRSTSVWDKRESEIMVLDHNIEIRVHHDILEEK